MHRMPRLVRVPRGPMTQLVINQAAFSFCLSPQCDIAGMAIRAGFSCRPSGLYGALVFRHAVRISDRSTRTGVGRPHRSQSQT